MARCAKLNTTKTLGENIIICQSANNQWRNHDLFRIRSKHMACYRMNSLKRYRVSASGY